MRVATFNVQNLRLRPDGRLDGARDRDTGESPLLDPEDRRLTAGVLARIDADVVALQEVFDSETLEFFHERFLLPAGLAPYPHRVCLPGNDGQGFDLAVLSRRPLSGVESHAAVTAAELGLDAGGVIPEDQPLFRRDCLRAGVDAITFFICHFKAPWPDPEAAWAVRQLEAQGVRRLVERHFPDPAAALWLILGDLNDPRTPPEGRDRAIAPLTEGFAVDLGQRVPEAERWTWFDSEDKRRSRPDRMLASPALAARFPDAVPKVLRAGLGREAGGGGRLTGTGYHRPHASDHAALYIDLPGL